MNWYTSLSTVDGLEQGVVPDPTSVTTSIVYWTPGLRPVISRSPAVVNEPVVTRLNVGLESGKMAVTENLSKLELPGVETPLPLMMMLVVVEMTVAKTGTSGSKIENTNR